MNKKELIPKRRFKEFENAGAWEQRKLGEVAEKFDNLRIPITAAKRKKGVTPYYGANGIQDYVEGYTHNGEFVLVAEDGANDLQNYPVHYVSGKIWVNNHAHVLQGKNRIADNLFLLNAIKKIQFETYLVGGSRAKLNADTMMKLPIKLPGFKEQQELGKYFYKLDNLIALHQRKLNKLKKMKSACLTEMFPAEGEREPKRRFPGFTGAWEQRKLIDLLNQPITDGPHETPNLVEKGIPFISADAIVDNRIDFSRKRGFITEEYDLQCRKKYGPELYDVYLVKSGSTVGKVAIVETTKQFNIWSPLAAMRCKGKTNPYFLYFLFQTKENQNQVKSKASNGTQPNLSMRELEQFNVQISPLHDEQQKIGAFFKQLDSLITLHQRKLDKIKKMKLAYLNELFV